jgi:hypothetical protein
MAWNNTKTDKVDPLADLTFASALALIKTAKDPVKGKPVGSYRLTRPTDGPVVVSYQGWSILRLFSNDTFQLLDLDAATEGGKSTTLSRRINTVIWRCFRMRHWRWRDGFTITTNPPYDPLGDNEPWYDRRTRAGAALRIANGTVIGVKTGVVLSGGRAPVGRKTTKGSKVSPGMVAWKQALIGANRSWSILTQLGTVSARAGEVLGTPATERKHLSARELHDAVMGDGFTIDIIDRLLATDQSQWNTDRRLQRVVNEWHGRAAAAKELARVRRYHWETIKEIIERGQ